MKRSQFYLYLVAFIFAATGALASVKLTPSQGFVKIPFSPFCTESVPCNNMGPICKDAQQRTVYDGSVKNSTSCGTVLLNQP